jgi:Flp pilus assembly pilin Flp
MRLMQGNHGFVADRAAVTALEYGIACAFFAVLLVGIFTNFSTFLVTLFNGVTTSL